MLRHRQSNRGTVGAAAIIQAYQRSFRMSPWAVFVGLVGRVLGVGGVFQLCDLSYREADEDVIQAVLLKDLTDLEKYVAEDFDCDDFMFRLMGVFHSDPRTCAMPIFETAVVIDGTMGHGVLSFYKDGVVKVIEPQNDRVYSVPDTWRLTWLCG